MTPLIVDRTSIEVDWECGMKYWWYKYAQGGGVVPAQTEEYFEVGRDIHTDTEGFPKGMHWSEILATLPTFESCEGDQFKLEQLARRRGWIIAFGHIIWPYITEHFTVYAIEKDLIFDRSPLWVQVKPDLLLESKKTGELVYIEYKSSATIGPKFALHWPTAIQMHLGIKAAEEDCGRKVSYGHVIGFDKGGWRGRLVHPFVWGYRSEKGEVKAKYTYGWDHYPAWEYEDHTKWVTDLCGEEVMREQFCWSEPIFYDERLIENVVKRRLAREKELALLAPQCEENEELRNLTFEMRTTKCQPTFGSPCAYKACCFNATVGADPLKSGMYVKRVPHHELDLIGVE